MNEAAVDQFSDQMMCDVDPWFWAYHSQIQLQAGVYTLTGHEWQIEPMQSEAKKRVARKGAQIGFSELEILRTLHGMINGRYPTGCLYLFPTQDDVSDFAKARFNPLIADNPQIIGKYIQSTDSTNIKRIGTGMLYLRGARLTTKVEGIKKDSSKLRSIPVDKVVFDERDLMDDAAVAMAIERMGHSRVKEYVSFSTPTIPDYGIDKEYQDSDQGVWMIRCQKCNKETCLEIEFPECIQDGKRVCKCGAEIFPRDGVWDALHPGRGAVGWWMSQLNSMYVNPGDILEAFLNPPEGNIQEVYNSKLGMAYIAAENRLTIRDVYGCCGLEPMQMGFGGPCAMGVDVGSKLHVVIGYRISAETYRIVKTVSVSTFEAVHDLAREFHVSNCVIDALPETHKVREFQAAEPYEVFLCEYQEKLATGPVWKLDVGIVKCNRTEVCDQTHSLIATPKKCELPRRCGEIERYAKEMSNIAKVLEEDKETGAKIYRYRKLGDDHYRHATNYFYLAAQRTSYRQRGGPRQTTADSDYAILGG